MVSNGRPNSQQDSNKTALDQYALRLSRVALTDVPHPLVPIQTSAERLSAFSRTEEAQKVMRRFRNDLKALWVKYADQVGAEVLDKPNRIAPVVEGNRSWVGDSPSSQGIEAATERPSVRGTGGNQIAKPLPPEPRDVAHEPASRVDPTRAENEPQSPSLLDQSKSAVNEKIDALKPGQVPTELARKESPVVPPKISIHLANAKDGVPYRFTAAATLVSGEKLKIVAVRFPDNLGLTFDEISQEISGVPKGAGEHRLNFQVEPRKGERVTVQGQLVVNPDPKSLWQINEPAADLGFRKPHCSGEHLRGAGLDIVVGSRRGRSHEHAGSFRDDDYAIWHDTGSGWSLVVVADGAGSAPLSREGSRVVCSTFHRQISSELASERGKSLADLVDRWEAERDQVTKEIGLSFVELFRGCAVAAIEAIESVAAEQAAVPKDFSTTLLAAAVLRGSKNTFVSTFWVGDGAIAVYGPRGKVRLMGSPDGGEFAGQTRFLDRSTISSSSFSGRVNIGRYEDVTSVILMTDGVSDPKFETDQGLMEATRWDAVWGEIEPLLAGENPSEAILEWLNFFSPGNHDDRTLAVLW